MVVAMEVTTGVVVVIIGVILVKRVGMIVVRSRSIMMMMGTRCVSFSVIEGHVVTAKADVFPTSPCVAREEEAM